MLMQRWSQKRTGWTPPSGGSGEDMQKNEQQDVEAALWQPGAVKPGRIAAPYAQPERKPGGRCHDDKRHLRRRWRDERPFGNDVVGMPPCGGKTRLGDTALLRSGANQHRPRYRGKVRTRKAILLRPRTAAPSAAEQSARERGGGTS